MELEGKHFLLDCRINGRPEPHAPTERLLLSADAVSLCGDGSGLSNDH